MVATAVTEINAGRSGRLMRALRAALALWLVLALAVGPVAIGAASGGAVDGLPCHTQMAEPGQSTPQDDLPVQQKHAPACPMMAGGVCLVLCALAPAVSGIPSPPHVAVPVTWREEAAAPRVVLPLRRPPRQL